jgi:uncharacterized membrane protein
MHARDKVHPRHEKSRRRVTVVSGPVDVVIIGFPGNKFTGKIAPAIKELVENNTIRILDLLFVSTDDDGTITSVRIQDLAADLEPGLVEMDVFMPGALDDHDAQELAEDLPANSSALLVAFENVWAAKFVAAIQEADAVVIDQIRIPASAVAELLA